MDITFNCDKCGQSLTIDEAGTGLVLQCPSCGKEITIPPKQVWLPAINEAVRAHVQMIVEGRGNLPEARLAIQKVLRESGYQPEPDDEGTAMDFGQFERQNLVIQTNVDMAYGYGGVVQQNDPDILDAYPALELVRVGKRMRPRGDPCYPPGSVGSIGWERRWQEAAEKSGDEDALKAFKKTGRMVALKSSPIWDSLGNLWDDSLGNPYPPFAWDSGMYTEDVERFDAEDLGLLTPADDPKPKCGLTPPRFIPMEDPRMTEWLRNQPEECGHCGEEKPRTVLTVCDDCGETICPDCKAKGCTRPEETDEPTNAAPQEPSDAIQCYREADMLMVGRKIPLEKYCAEKIVSLCDRAFEFGFRADLHELEANTHRMRGEALESLGFKDRALKEYELAVEKDPQVGVKKRIASLRKECGKE